MMKTSFIALLILGFSLFWRTIQADNTTAAKATVPSSHAGSQCKPNELLSENGCVDRNVFLNQVIKRSWKDKGFDKGKDVVGVVDTSKCKADEVKTPFGCEKYVVPKSRTELRVPVASSIQKREKTVGHSSKRVRSQPNGDDKLEQPKKRKKQGILTQRTSGEARPMKYVFLPGRRLRKGKKCRPYEVLGRRRRCIRRKRPKVSKLTTRHIDT